MADFDNEDTGSEEEEESSEEDTENEGADSDSDDSEEEDEDDADSEEEDDSEDTGDGDKGKSKKSEKKDANKDDDEEPQKRPRSVADFVAIRRGKAAKKGKEQKKSSDQGNDGEDDDEEDGEDAGEKPLTTKDLEKALTPFMQKEEEARVSSDISAFIERNPDFKPYADKARKFALHPNRREIPIKAIFYEVAGDDLLKIGAKRKAKADVEGKKSRTGGDSGGRGGEGDGSSVWSLPKKDFEKMQQEVRNKQ